MPGSPATVGAEMSGDAPPNATGSRLLRVRTAAQRVVDLLEKWVTPLFDLGLRLYVAEIFLRAGWLKISSWDSTLALFESEYHVPLLPSHMAAVLGTAGELVLPVLLVLGLAGRFSAAGLFVVNIVAVVAYAEISDLGLQDHLLWGVMLLMIFLHGPGRLSCDHWLKSYWAR